MPTSAELKQDIAQRMAGGRDFSTVVQRDAIARAKPLEAQLEQLKGRFARDVNDTSQERRRLQAGVSSTIAGNFQRIGGNQQSQFSGNLQQLLRKAKARSSISRRGESAIANQQLKDRISIARQGVGRRGQALRAIGASGRARVGLDTSIRQSKDTVSAAISGAAGSIAGGLASGIKNGLFSKRLDPFEQPSLDAGTANADFQNINRQIDFTTPRRVDDAPFTPGQAAGGLAFA